MTESTSAPSTRFSPGRDRNLWRLMVPEIRETELGSIVATRRIGKKIRRLVGNTTIRPITRGGLGRDRMATTTSRIRPMSSPSGPMTASPANLATKALLRFAMRLRLDAVGRGVPRHTTGNGGADDRRPPDGTRGRRRRGRRDRRAPRPAPAHGPRGTGKQPQDDR